MIEVRFHGRYGQPVARWAALVAEKAIKEGHYAQIFESFSAYRPGAPLEATVRINDTFIRTRSSNATKPDIVVVLDNSLFQVSDVVHGLKTGGVVLAAAPEPDLLKGKSGFRFISLELPQGASQERREAALLEALASLLRSQILAKMERKIYH